MFGIWRDPVGMGEIVNLNKARKARDKGATKRDAANNRVTYGLSRAEKDKAQREAERHRLQLNGHRRDPAGDDPA